MQAWQFISLIFVLIYSLVAFILGFIETKKRKNPFGLTSFLNPLGIFVYADAMVFGIFFFLVSLISLFLSNIYLFLLVYSVFWVVRSIGEQVYWFLEQFTEKNKNKPADLRMSKYYPGKSIYIHYQIFWQCISVIAIISSVYLFYKLLS